MWAKLTNVAIVASSLIYLWWAIRYGYKHLAQYVLVTGMWAFIMFALALLHMAFACIPVTRGSAVLWILDHILAPMTGQRTPVHPASQCTPR